MSRPSPTVRRRRLRYELRRLRTERDLTIDDVQDRSNGDIRAPTLSRWETGERSIRPTDLRLLLDIYEVAEPEREVLLTLARQAKERGWWQAYASVMPESFHVYVGLEAEAAAIRAYAAELVPGLLQTADYYRAYLTTAPANPDVDRKVEVRLARQERLAGGDRPRFWVVMNEAVIRRTVGGTDVMRAQLARIVDVSGLPEVTIQVLPFSGGAHPAMEGPFSILDFPEPGLDPTVVYLENQAGSVYLEEDAQVDRYSQTFDHLIARALSPEDSVRMIGEAADALDSP